MNLDVDAVGRQLHHEDDAVRDQERHRPAPTTRGTSLTDYNLTDPGANDAHGFGEVTLKMLKDWQGYNSIDNKGFMLVSTCTPARSSKHRTTTPLGRHLDELRRRRRARSDFFEFTGSLDVIAHEIRPRLHRSSTRTSTYSAQSGGMNESFSDIAGTTAKFYYDAKTRRLQPRRRHLPEGQQYIRWMCKPSTDGMSIDNASQYTVVARRALQLGRHEPRLLPRRPSASRAPIPTPAPATRRRRQEGVAGLVRGERQPLDLVGDLHDRLPGRHRRGDGAEVHSPGDISALGDSWKDVGVTCKYTHVNDFGMTLTPATATAMAGTDGDLHGRRRRSRRATRRSRWR